MTSRGKYIATVSGRAYYPTAPDAAELDIEDIAHALSNICRYTGHTRKFYSVAEHSVIMSYIVPPEHAYVALMHDATEAYIGDVARPIKYLFPDYERLEDKNWKVIAEKFGLPTELPEIVKYLDSAICNVEMAELIPHFTKPTLVDEFKAPEGVKVRGLLPFVAKQDFLNRYDQLRHLAVYPDNVMTDIPRVA